MKKQTLKSDFNDIGKKLIYLEKPKYPEYSIQMIASKSNIIKSFNLTTGKGFGNFTNWFLCNGLNGLNRLKLFISANQLKVFLSKIIF